MKAILHLGDQKNGSKSIQEFLNKNVGNLRREGVLKPKAAKMGPYDAGFRALAGDSNWAKQFATKRGLEDDTVEAVRQYIDTGLREELESQTGSLAIFSFEGLLGMADQEKEALVCFLDQYFDEIDAVVFLRRNDRKVRSGYVTRIQNAGITERDLFFNKNGVARGPHYLSHIQKWSELLGRDRLQVLNFDKSDDVVQDFIAAVELEGPFDYEDEQRNVAPSAYGLEVMLRFNERMADLEPYCQKPVAIRRQIRQMLHEGEKYKPARQRAIQHYEAFREENERLGEALLGVKQDFFDHDFSEYPEEEMTVEVDDSDFQAYIRKAAQNCGLAV